MTATPPPRSTAEASAAVPAATVPLLISGALDRIAGPAVGGMSSIRRPARCWPACPAPTAEELGAAVDAARQAGPGWRRLPPADRAVLFGRYRLLIRDALPELTALLVAERGKTRAEARDELLRTLEVVRLAARIAAVEMAGQACEVSAGIETRSRLEALGVCAGITPYDDPALLPVSMFAITVAAGNTFVLKPSRQVPLTTMRLVELRSMPACRPAC